MKISRANVNPKISEKIALLIIIIFGAVTAWVVINIGEKIINNAADLAASNANEIIQSEIK